MTVRHSHIEYCRQTRVKKKENGEASEGATVSECLRLAAEALAKPARGIEG